MFMDPYRSIGVHVEVLSSGSCIMLFTKSIFVFTCTGTVFTSLEKAEFRTCLIAGFHRW